MRYYLSNPYLPHAAAAASSDALALAGSLAAAALLTNVPVARAGPMAALSVIGAFLALYYCDAYSLQTITRVERAGRSLMLALGLGSIAACLVYFFVPLESWMLPMTGMACLVYAPIWLLGRHALQFALPALRERVAIVGVSDLGLSIAQELHRRAELGTNFLGFLSDRFPAGVLLEGSLSGNALPIVGPIHEVSKLADELRLTRVVVASGSRDEFFPAEELLELKMRGVKVVLGSEYYEQLTGCVYLQDLKESYLIFGQGFRTTLLAEFTRRTLDITGALAGLVLASPVLLLAAAAVKLDSSGRIFFRQERVGLLGRSFSIVKLRTMVENAEGTSGPRFASKGDARITRVGRFLRKTRLDELPQLWNVLVGQMSLVGPRPERPEFVHRLREGIPFFGLRTSVKPGVTGWAQIRDGYANSLEDFQDKLAHDLYYIKTRSLGMDLMVLWLTLKTMFRMDGI